jgi:hypothetical protein
MIARHDAWTGVICRPHHFQVSHPPDFGRGLNLDRVSVVFLSTIPRSEEKSDHPSVGPSRQR